MTSIPQSPPVVSVLMPAFNAARFIGESIKSVLAQTYPHFELLILDDGSTDQTHAIATAFTDSRIRILRHEQNQGLVVTRNALVNAATGKYIAFLDADDIAAPTRLAEQVALLEGGSTDVCGTDHFTLYQATGRRKKSKQVHRDADIRAMMVVACPLCNPSVMGKAAVFKSHPYQSSLDVAEDYALWQTLSLAGYRFANLKQNLLTYRVHDGQISQEKLAQTQAANIHSQERYLLGLEIPPHMRPRPLAWTDRLRTGPAFLWQLNKRIKRVSVKANYQIYARFQKRGNRIWTIFTRLERLLVALVASLRGHL
ncbi:glycosyltransferase family 2 protein [Polynucleobacter sphagniphilus]|uniref:glycosyltransferase family 2 protein n=1 Tax=Polynucleobacter sphagniphilus TaxID=1743169 RepID=UPI0024070B61|nr:glycosyltransferase family 2 protein [Polynucleobacter sphagniphilus]